MKKKYIKILSAVLVISCLFVLLCVSASADGGEYYRPTDKFTFGNIYSEGKASTASSQYVGVDFDNSKGTATYLSQGLNQESKYDYLNRYMMVGSTMAGDGYYDIEIYSTINWLPDMPLCGANTTMCLYLPFAFASAVANVPITLAERFSCSFTYVESFGMIPVEVNAQWIDKDFIGVEWPIEGYFYVEIMANSSHQITSDGPSPASPISFSGFNIHLMVGNGTQMSPVFATALGNVTVQCVSTTISDAPLYPVPGWDGFEDWYEEEMNKDDMMDSIDEDLTSFNDSSAGFLHDNRNALGALRAMFSSVVLPDGTRLRGLVNLSITLGLFGALLGIGVSVYKHYKGGE